MSGFNATASYTFEKLDQVFSYYYYQGDFSGTYAKDTLSLGGIVVQEQQFALVDHIKKSMLANDYKSSKKYANEMASTQGVLGLGHKSMVQVPSENASDLYDPLIYAMTKQSLIPEQVFSFYTNSVLSKGWVDELTLGSVNVDRYTGDVDYAAVPAISMDGNDSTPSEHTLWVVQGTSLGVLDEAMYYNGTSQKKPDKFDTRNCITLSTARHEVHSHRHRNVAFIHRWIICSTNSFSHHARHTA